MKFLLFLIFFSSCFCDLRSITGHTLDELEQQIETLSNNERFKEDLIEIKYLQEKLQTLQNEEKDSEALVLDRRIKRKVFFF